MLLPTQILLDIGSFLLKVITLVFSIDILMSLAKKAFKD